MSETSYYNSGGSSAAEFWQVDLGAPLALISSVTFVNRAAATTTCWTPPVSWTAQGIVGTCDTRAINQTLRVLDGGGATLAAYTLSAAATQSFYMTQCSPTPTPSATATPSLSRGATASGTPTMTQSVTASVPPVRMRTL